MRTHSTTRRALSFLQIPRHGARSLSTRARRRQASLRHEGDSLEVAFFLTVNTILSAMQAYWTMLILDGVKNIVKGTAAHKQNGKDV